MLEPGKQYTIRKDFDGDVNCPHDDIYAQIRANIRRQLPQFQPHDVNNYKALILGGGPTLSKFKDEIVKKRKLGWKLITTNATHGWVQELGLEPSMHVMLDARQFNSRFVDTPVKLCRYMLCSQVHGDVFDKLIDNDVYIWHSGAPSGVELNILNRYYNKRWISVLGGTTVGLRAIGIAVMLGIRYIDVYGMDSCIIKGSHHAYSQPENDVKSVCRVRVGRKIFRCYAWMIKQADEFLAMSQLLPSDLKLTIHGDGMLSYIVKQTVKLGKVPSMTVLDTIEG